MKFLKKESVLVTGRLLTLAFIIFSTTMARSSENQTIPTNVDLFENKKIVVLGGTGYLGRAIAQEVLKYNPKNVVIFSRDEVKHFYTISKVFNNDPRVLSVLGDIRDYDSLLRVTRHADIVFHVAALKRMDCLEDNVEEAIKTNVLATMNVFNACVANNVNKVLFISTDKACSPINTYGACKFVSEKIFTNYNIAQYKTKFMVVRFGNILESTGSVIPIFIDKVKAGREIPLTDDQMTRFIIDKEEAAKLIFDALRYGQGGEIFIKKLSAMKITDLIEVIKARYKSNNTIKVIGLRPGEKIHEVLINESEIMRAISFKDFYVITPSITHWSLNHGDNMPLYISKGLSLKTHLSKDYSSGDAVISQEELAHLLSKFGFLD